MANTNQQIQNPNVSFQIKGQAGWGRLTHAATNKWGQAQYTLTIENPVFADDQGNESLQSMDPNVAAVIQQAQNSLVRPGTQQYPNPSIMVNMRAQRQDGTVQKPRYFDDKTKSEVPVEHELNSGTAITAIMGGHLSDTSSNGVTLYLNGIIVPDASDPNTWYTQNPLLAGFKTLNDDTQNQHSQVTPQDFANASANKQNPVNQVPQGGNNGAPQGSPFGNAPTKGNPFA